MDEKIPSEFALFVRETAVRAFDRLAETNTELDAPLRAVVRSWSKLTEAQKSTLFDEVIACAQFEAPEPPPKPKRAVKRYAVEEVEKTLPKKPKKPTKAKK